MRSPAIVLPNFPGFPRAFLPVLLMAAGLLSPLPAGAQSLAPTPRAAETGEAAKPNAVPPAPAPAAKAEPDAPKSLPGTGSALIPHDLSPYGMFLNADIVVKVVMVGLALASLATWTILLAKGLELAGARGRASRGLNRLTGASTLREASDALADPKAPVTRLAQAALAEAERSGGLPHEGVKDRAAALLARVEARAGRSMARGTGLLATIGSTAPFVGLFGTVWGIMNAFIGISKTNTTNLAVVAPGIAEALLATAFGLVAAIPAVIIYNVFARGITTYRSILGDASTEVMRLLSRDLDRDGAAPVRRAAE
jgi:biopolymer transport protein ExbB